MSFIPLADSGLPYTFTANGAVTLAGSTVTSTVGVGSGNAWSLNFGSLQGAVRVRVTVSGYVSNANGGTYASAASVVIGGVATANTSVVGLPTQIIGFTPAAVTGAVTASAPVVAMTSTEWGAAIPPETYTALIEVDVLASYNCTCDDTTGNATLLQLRQRLMRRLGWGAMVASPPPGVADLLNDFLQSAQVQLYQRPNGEFRTERFFSWPLEQGQRLYDLPDNGDECTKKLDPRQITWVGIRKDALWRPLAAGIAPELYNTEQTSDWPLRYEIRQCIELWPPPDESSGELVIKGRFELEPFSADADKTTINSEAVFLLALANAKAHYRQPDAANYVQQLEVLIHNLVAGSHATRRYLPGYDDRADYVYTVPRATTPFPDGSF